MLKLKKLLAICFAALVFVLSSCADATDDTLDELQDTIDTTFDPDDEKDGGGGVGTTSDPDDDKDDGGGVGGN